MHPFGSMDLVDIEVLSRAVGRDFLPYPFMHTQPLRFASADEFDRHAGVIRERITGGDLAHYRNCLDTYLSADIRVESNVRYKRGRPPIRVIAFRRGDKGFLAEQRPNADVVDLYTLSPFDIGPAVAERSGLVAPGIHQRIVVPEYAPPHLGRDDDAFRVGHSAGPVSPSLVEVQLERVIALGTIQSHWRPTRRWGFDKRKSAAVWFRVAEDGDYVFAPDYSSATPIKQHVLAEKIDRLIAADVAVLRRFLRD